MMTLLPARRLGRLSARLRFLVARRPWIRWLVVVGLAAVVGLATQSALARVDAERNRWASLTTVAVATIAHRPGDSLTYEWRTLPVVAVPSEAFDADGHRPLPTDAEARQRIGPGEIIVVSDLTVGPGPASGVDPDQIVVAVSDPLVVAPPIGVAVNIYSEGIELTHGARIVDVLDDIVYVAVRAADAPLVTAAAQLRQASIGFTP